MATYVVRIHLFEQLVTIILLQIILNPGGSVGSTGYFNIANQIITIENYYSSFRCANSQLDCTIESILTVSLSPSQLTIDSTHPANQQAVILHDAPSTPPSSLISQLVGSDKVASVYITDDTQANNGNPYDSFPSQFASFVSTVSADS